MTATVPVIDISGFARGDDAWRARIAREVSLALEEIEAPAGRRLGWLKIASQGMR